jgi:hypothetical protein
LAVPANELVHVHLTDSVALSQYSELTLRLHSDHKVGSFAIWWRTRDAKTHNVSVRTDGSQGWQVLSVFMFGASGWSIDDRVTELGLRFPEGVLLDFVVLHD